MRMHLQDLLARQTSTFFTGRAQLLAAMHRHATSEEWKLVHLYGPGGIGKTTLLRRFADSLPAGKTVYAEDPAQWLNELDRRSSGGAKRAADSADPEEERARRMADALNAHADACGGIVLLLDGFEPWSPVADWLRDRFLPRIRTNQIRVITAGRQPLQGQWMAGGWQLLVVNKPVEPLTPADIRHFAAARGIDHPETVASLIRFSRGVPLALSLAAELMLRKGHASVLEPVDEQRLIGTLVGRLMDELSGSPLERLAETAAIVWKFDQELLGTMIGKPVPTETFRQFCRLPIVVRRQDRWSVHDAVREWMAADFRNRKPQAWQTARNNALAALRARSALEPGSSPEIGFELLCLHDSPFVRGFCFQLDDALDIRPIGEKDLERVEQLYLGYLHARFADDPADNHLTPLIRPLWAIEPNAFVGLWQQDQLVAFIASHRLTPAAIELLRGHPLTRPAVSAFQGDGKHDAFLICLSGVEPELEVTVNGSLARATASLLQRQARFLNLLPRGGWESFLTLLGYERLPAADAASADGTPYRAYRLDLTRTDLATRMAHSLSECHPIPEAADAALPETPAPDFQDTAREIHRLLKRYGKLPQEPEQARAFINLLSDARGTMNDGTMVKALQERVQEIVDRLENGHAEDRRLGRILRYAYIQKIGTHEAAADFLDIPVPSYYRYLRAAVRRFAHEWLTGF